MPERVFDCSVDSELLTGMRLARAAIGRGGLVVIPTDTVYGIAADAFDPKAVQKLLDAKGRDRTSPPPVLIPGIPTLDALAADVPEEVRALVEAFWPGGLTVILTAQPSLNWDLGETRGTVALRMPANTIALELLSETGPLAVSSANRTGEPSALDAATASASLGDSIDVYLDGGAAGTAYGTEGIATAAAGSTIVDATALQRGGKLHIVREGVISRMAVQSIVGDALAEAATAPDAASGSEPAPAPASASAEPAE